MDDAEVYGLGILGVALVSEEGGALTTLAQRLLAYLPAPAALDWQQHHAAAWRRGRWQSDFEPLLSLEGIGLDELLHIDDQKQLLVANTEQFLAQLPANHALLWGARGTGKSSLIHALLNAYAPQGLRFIEVGKRELPELPLIAERVADLPYRFILFCDDLSFDEDDGDYKALKSALEGSVFKTADNLLIYATSNRRHLLPEYMRDNQQSTMREGELHEGEAIEEKISLSDRFGLWLSFYQFRQDAYLDLVKHWVAKLAAQHRVPVHTDDDAMRAAALQWALARGVRSGRTAQHFARHWVGQSALQTRRP